MSTAPHSMENSAYLRGDRPKELEDVFKTNFFGPFNITQAVLPKLRAKGSGTLLYMSSQAGWHGDATAGGYCSSKFALEGWSKLCHPQPDGFILLTPLFP